jgi:hypothetical protein
MFRNLNACILTRPCPSPLTCYRDDWAGKLIAAAGGARAGTLTTLRELNLFKNELEGPLPLAFSQLTALTLLDLSGNGSLGTCLSLSFSRSYLRCVRCVRVRWCGTSLT